MDDWMLGWRFDKFNQSSLTFGSQDPICGAFPGAFLPISEEQHPQHCYCKQASIFDKIYDKSIPGGPSQSKQAFAVQSTQVP